MFLLTSVCVCAEGPPGRAASAQLLGGQSAPADRPAGLQGAEQGWFLLCLVSEQQKWVSRGEVRLGGGQKANRGPLSQVCTN